MRTLAGLAVGLAACWRASGAKTELGVATSAYQVEGAWGRTDSVWDVFARTPGRIRDGSNGNEASDNYHHWDEDLDLARWLGATVYRFSLSWTRLLPNATGTVNREGARFYNQLIDGILARNMTPLATIFHWDSPQYLQDAYGGWQDDRMIDDVAAYARLCFTLFGDRVQDWATLNEPLTYVNLGYGNGQHAPGLTVANPYEVAHRSIRAHAKVYHLYHDEFAATQGGRISIALNSDFVQPADPNNPEDVLAAERGLLWRMGLYADPLFFGDYPQQVRDRCGDRLPRFTEDVSGTLDYFSLNHYTTLEARPWRNNQYSFFTDPETSEAHPASSLPTAAPWLHVYPEGIYKMIQWLRDRYDLRMDLVVTESGVATPAREIQDDLRATYLDGYIRNALRARDELGVNLTRYCVWSLIDNWEWSEGYTQAFGLVAVDFDSPDKKRTPKHSAHWLRNQNFFSSSGDPLP